jgi:XTP/dITP diphosphohydrolase
MGRRQLIEPTLVIATHNKGKLVEIAALMVPFGIACVSAGDKGVREPEETETTFEGNAALKALHSARETGLPALADDSGLCVDALGGDPGLYSARWAGPTKDFGLAMRKVEESLQAKNAIDRRAHFVACLTLAWPDGHCETFRGEIHGSLVWPPRGANGFGYDPMFVAENETITCGEMDPARKHAISHRARAFALLVEGCLSGRRR